jgi:hypothetical protein
VEKGIPEIKVLLPEGYIQSKDFRVIIVHQLTRLSERTGPRHQYVDRVARHKARNHPIDGHRNEKRKDVNEEFSSEIASHIASFLKEDYRKVLPPLLQVQEEGQ